MEKHHLNDLNLTLISYPGVQGLPASAAPALRGLQKVLSQLHDDLSGPCDENLYTLRYLAAAKRPAPEAAAQPAALLEAP